MYTSAFTLTLVKNKIKCSRVLRLFTVESISGEVVSCMFAQLVHTLVG